MRRVRTIGLILIALYSAGHRSVRDFEVGNSSSYIGNKRWSWTVYITAPRNVLDQVKCVEYTLHPTFPDPIQTVCNRGTDDARAFALTASGWGEFDIAVKVTFRDRPPQATTYRLRLQPPATSPCRVMVQRRMTEDEVWTLPDPFRPLHIYVEDLQRGRPADLVVFSTRGNIDDNSFDWLQFKNQLRPANETVRIPNQTFVTVHAAANTLLSVGRSDNGPVLQIFVSEPTKGTAQISLCAPPSASQR